MDKINDVSLKLVSNPEIYEQLKEFVNFCIDNKKLLLSLDEFIVSQVLIDSEILNINDNKIVIENLYAFSKVLFDSYQDRNQFELSSDFSKTFNFISELKHEFKEGGLYKIMPFLWEYAIYTSNIQFKVSFENFHEYLSKNSQENYFLLKAYSCQLPYLNLENNQLIESIISIVDYVKREAEEGIINIDYNNLLNTLSLIAKSDPERGKDLIKTSVEMDRIDSDIISSLIRGAYNSRYQQSITLIKYYIDKEIRLDAIFTGLAGIDSVTKAEAELFLGYFEKYCIEDDIYKKPLVLLLFSIINSNTLEEELSFIEQSFNNLFNIIANESLVPLVLNKISFVEKYTKERIDLICKVITKDFYTNEKFISLIAQTFWYLHDIEYLKIVLLELAHKQPFSNFSKKFTECFSEYNRERFDEMLLGFITNEKANVRFLGMSFFNDLNVNSPYTFHYSILKLNPLEQYKLMVCITENYNEPKNTMPCLMPLLDSSSKTIRESFVCKLEEYSENYGGHVIDVLTKYLDNKIHKTTLERVKKYMEIFYDKNVKVKYGVNELDPYYTQSKYINLYNKMFSKKFNQMIQKATNEENSFLSAVKSIKLAKGGGWKTGDNRDISKLFSIGHTFAMPRNHLIFPNRFDIEYGVAIHKDWKDEDFKLIINLINNEQ
ncbi:hypothetical protein CMT34_11935 [Elizabethkingia anophelis]|nr:hypothetical protein [Elizabethkingia anophelis]